MGRQSRKPRPEERDHQIDYFNYVPCNPTQPLRAVLFALAVRSLVPYLENFVFKRVGCHMLAPPWDVETPPIVTYVYNPVTRIIIKKTHATTELEASTPASASKKRKVSTPASSTKASTPASSTKKLKFGAAGSPEGVAAEGILEDEEEEEEEAEEQEEEEEEAGQDGIDDDLDAVNQQMAGAKKTKTKKAGAKTAGAKKAGAKKPKKAS